MAKFRTQIGYSQTRETSPGVHTEEIVERTYSGDVLRESRGWQPKEGLNENVTINNRYSIVADPFANTNIYQMRYIKIDGVAWKIQSVEILRPRLIISIGGVYNGV